MLSIDPLKYRGVFDYPNNQSANLLASTAPSTSTHVLKFMGWIGIGKYTRFSGDALPSSLFNQKAVCTEKWFFGYVYDGVNAQLRKVLTLKRALSKSKKIGSADPKLNDLIYRLKKSLSVSNDLELNALVDRLRTNRSQIKKQLLG